MTIGDGVYLVGTGSEPDVPRIEAGVWEASGPVEDGAYWYWGQPHASGGADHLTDSLDGTTPAMTAFIPAQAYAFETQGFGTWTRTGDPPILSVKTDSGWHSVSSPDLGAENPYGTSHLATADFGDAFTRWATVLSNGRTPLRVKTDGGWVIPARAEQGRDRQELGRLWFWPLTFMESGINAARVSGGGHPPWTGLYTDGERYGTGLDYPSSLSWWGTTTTRILDTAGAATIQADAQVFDDGFIHRYMTCCTYVVDLDLIRWVIRAYDPTGVRVPQLRLTGNPVTSDSDGYIAGEQNIWLVTGDGLDYAGVWAEGAHSYYDGYYGHPSGRDILPRAYPSGTGTPSELVGTIASDYDPDTGTIPTVSLLYPLDMSALTGVRALRFLMACVDPSPSVPLSGSRIATVTSTTDVLFELAA